MTKTKSTNSRSVGLEQFYTTKTMTDLVLSRIRNKPWFRSATEFVEPSAGAGVFVDELMKQSPHTPVRAYDLQPKHRSVKKQDYLKLNLGYKRGRVFIGNPPWGKRQRLTKQFLNKAAKEGDYIVFLVGAGMRKPSLITDVEKKLHLIEEWFFGDVKFEGPDGCKVKTVLQVWERRDYDRPDWKPTKTSSSFEFVKDHTEADFTFTTHGSRCGDITPPQVSDESSTSRRLIKVKDGVDKPYVLSVFAAVDWNSYAADRTTGQRSLGRSEVFDLFDLAASTQINSISVS
jgi:predicted RNA methylase